jgi:pyocin large subunit-like protein
VERRFSGRAARFGAATLCVLLFVAIACGSPQAPPTQAQKTKDAIENNAVSSHVKRPDVGFASRQKLVDHYRKHGREFGSITMEQYLRSAQELRDRPAGGAILEAARPDGSVTRFDRDSGDFIAFSRDGVIRTYFKPTDGERYYRRQLERRH